jgi:hypothetical protein
VGVAVPPDAYSGSRLPPSAYPPSASAIRLLRHGQCLFKHAHEADFVHLLCQLVSSHQSHSTPALRKFASMRFCSASSTLLIASLAVSSAAAFPIAPHASTPDVSASSPAVASVAPSASSMVTPSPVRKPTPMGRKRYPGLGARVSDTGLHYEADAVSTALCVEESDANSIEDSQTGLPAFIQGVELEPEAAIPVNTRTTPDLASTESAQYQPTDAAAPTTTVAADGSVVTSGSVTTVTVTVTAPGPTSTDSSQQDSSQQIPDEMLDDDPVLGSLIDDLNVVHPLPVFYTEALPAAPTAAPLEPTSTLTTPFAQITATPGMLENDVALLEASEPSLTATRPEGEEPSINAGTGQFSVPTPIGASNSDDDAMASDASY